MPVYTEELREVHGKVFVQAADLRSAAREIPQLGPAGRAARLRRVIRYLETSVEPQLLCDEALALSDARDRASPLLWDSLSYDRLAIRHWIHKIAEADSADVACLQQLLYGLDALIRVHIWKESELHRSLESTVASAFPCDRRRSTGRGKHQLPRSAA